MSPEGSGRPQMNGHDHGPSICCLGFNHLVFLKPGISCPLVFPGLSLNWLLASTYTLVGLVFMSITGLLCNRVLSSLTCKHGRWIMKYIPSAESGLRTHSYVSTNEQPMLTMGDLVTREMLTVPVLPTILSLAQGRSHKGFGFSNRHCTIP